MKLGDIKGKKQLQVVGRLAALADTLSDDEQFADFVECVKNGENREKAFFKLGPLLMRDDIADGIVDVMAFAKGVSPEEVDNPMAEIMELVTSDLELPAFLSEQQ